MKKKEQKPLRIGEKKNYEKPELILLSDITRVEGKRDSFYEFYTMGTSYGGLS